MILDEILRVEDSGTPSGQLLAFRDMMKLPIGPEQGSINETVGFEFRGRRCRLLDGLATKLVKSEAI